MISKAQASSDPAYGKPPEMRNVYELLSTSFLNVDKPPGPTSHQVTAWVRDMLEVKKAGHAGTLDPNVSGVLPIGLNRATRLLRYLLFDTKEYVALMRLHRGADEDKIVEAMKNFSGEIEQRVPLRSAVKKRKRKRRISDLEILEIEGRDVLFRAEVESGTYIRTLCVDVGKALRTGANMVQLRRVRSSVFDERDSFILQDVIDAHRIWKDTGDETGIRKVLLPVERGFQNFRKVFVRDSSISALCHGADLALPGVVSFDEKIRKNSSVAIMSLKNELVAIGRVLMDGEPMYEKENGIAVDVETVVMERGTYPKMWN